MPETASETAPQPIPKSRRTGGRRRSSPPITGEARNELRRKAVQLYNPAPDAGRPLSIREIAARLDRSYGFIRALLVEAGTVLRPDNRHKEAANRHNS